MKGNLLYSKSTELNVNVISKIAVTFGIMFDEKLIHKVKDHSLPLFSLALLKPHLSPKKNNNKVIFLSSMISYFLYN